MSQDMPLVKIFEIQPPSVAPSFRLGRNHGLKVECKTDSMYTFMICKSDLIGIMINLSNRGKS